MRFNELYHAVEQDRRTFEEESIGVFCGEFNGSQELSDLENEEDEIYPANKLTSKRPVIAACAATSRVLRESTHDSSSEDLDCNDDIPEVA